MELRQLPVSSSRRTPFVLMRHRDNERWIRNTPRSITGASAWAWRSGNRVQADRFTGIGCADLSLKPE
jgi:hypothetical protein